MNNNKNTIEEILKRGRKISISDDERLIIRDGISQFMAEHPVVRNSLWERLLGDKGRLVQYYQLITYSKSMIAIPLILVLVFGGGISVSAERALPGDFLYPVKVSVNEEIMEFFQVGSEAEAEFQADLATKRLDEAVKLAAQGKLRVEARADLEKRLEAHIAKIVKEVNKLETRNDFETALEVSGDLDASLRAHEEALRVVGNAKGESKVEIEKLNISIKGHIVNSLKVSDDAEAKVRESSADGLRSSAEGKLKAAENKIAEVRKYIEKNGAKFDAESKAEAEARLALAEKMIVEGKAKVQAEMYADAFALFTKAHRTAEETKHLLVATIDILLDLRRGKDEDKDIETELESDTRAKVDTTKKSDDDENDSDDGEELKSGTENKSDVRKTEVRVNAKVEAGVNVGL